MMHTIPGAQNQPIFVWTPPACQRAVRPRLRKIVKLADHEGEPLDPSLGCRVAPNQSGPESPMKEVNATIGV